MNSNAAVAGVLGAFVVNTAWEDIPAETRRQASRSLLNFCATALGAADHPDVDAMIQVLATTAGSGAATLIGRRERMDVLSAAFVNAVTSNFHDFDDTHLATIIHPTAPVMPPLLALAEQRGLSGQAVLHAFLIGAEIECRLGNSVTPGQYGRGWHITATTGVFGAAAAAAQMLGLDAGQVAHALGIAASQSSGLVENLPTGARSVAVGNAARNGLFAALLAERGLTAAPAAIEGRLGWARAMGDVPKIDEITGDLGTRWEIGRNTYKPYPCGIVMHAVIDACLELRAAHALSPAAIAEVVVAGNALLLARADRVAANERDARVSLQHGAAAAFFFGSGGLDVFAEAVVMRPDIAEFRMRVRAERDDSLPVGAARVTVRTTAGAAHSATVVHARGSLEQPMSDAAIGDKLRSLAGPGFDADGIIAAVWAIERADGVAPLLGKLRAG